MVNDNYNKIAYLEAIKERIHTYSGKLFQELIVIYGGSANVYKSLANHLDYKRYYYKIEEYKTFNTKPYTHNCSWGDDLFVLVFDYFPEGPNVKYFVIDAAALKDRQPGDTVTLYDPVLSKREGFFIRHAYPNKVKLNSTYGIQVAPGLCKGTAQEDNAAGDLRTNRSIGDQANSINVAMRKALEYARTELHMKRSKYMFKFHKKVYVNLKKKTLTVLWLDGSSTTIKLKDDDNFDIYSGYCIAYTKRFYTNTTRLNKWLEEDVVLQSLDENISYSDNKDLIELGIDLQNYFNYNQREYEVLPVDSDGVVMLKITQKDSACYVINIALDQLEKMFEIISDHSGIRSTIPVSTHVDDIVQEIERIFEACLEQEKDRQNNFIKTLTERLYNEMRAWHNDLFAMFPLKFIYSKKRGYITIRNSVDQHGDAFRILATGENKIEIINNRTGKAMIFNIHKGDYSDFMLAIKDRSSCLWKFIDKGTHATRDNTDWSERFAQELAKVLSEQASDSPIWYRYRGGDPYVTICLKDDHEAIYGVDVSSLDIETIVLDRESDRIVYKNSSPMPPEYLDCGLLDAETEKTMLKQFIDNFVDDIAHKRGAVWEFLLIGHKENQPPNEMDSE